MQQKGNILFLILLAVVLFAALSYAVTQSLRGGGKDGSSESADAVAADILGWFGQIDTAVMRMMLVNNVPLEQIDFNDPNNFLMNGNPSFFNNTNCATTNCEVFSPDGGNVPPREFNKSAGTTTYTPAATQPVPGNKSYMVMLTPNVGTSAPDVGLRIGYVKKEVCNAINRRVGISENLDGGISGVIVQYIGNLTQVTNALKSTVAYTWSSPEIAGRHTFCDNGLPGPAYHIYHVVIER